MIYYQFSEHPLSKDESIKIMNKRFKIFVFNYNHDKYLRKFCEVGQAVQAD